MADVKVTIYAKRVTNKRGAVSIHWYLRWADSSGRQRYEKIGTKPDMTRREAERLKREKITALGAGTASRDRCPKRTLADFLAADRTNGAADRQPSTLNLEKTVAKCAIAALGGETPLDRIDYDHVAKIKAWLGAEHRLEGRECKPSSKATIKKTISTLRAAFGRALEAGLIQRNPFSGRAKGKVQPKRKRIYSMAEADAMVEAAPTLWWATFIRLAFTSGLRLGEVLNLTWEDVEDGQVIVSAKRAERFTVNGQDYPLIPFSAKSHQERHVPLDGEAGILLQRLRLKRDGSVYLFLSLKRLRALEGHRDLMSQPPAGSLVNSLLRDFKVIQNAARARLEARADEPVEWRSGTLHDLRKSYGTHMAKLVSMNDLKVLMGHASITTTAEYYLDPSDDVADKSREVFARRTG